MRPRPDQFRLNFDAPPPPPLAENEVFDGALESTFPAGPLTEDELYQEFLRLFPDYAPVEETTNG